MRVPPVLLALLLLCAVLAGCAGSTSDGGTTTTTPKPGSAGGNQTVASLGWRLGDWWDQHWFLGVNDTVGFLVKTVVAENRSGSFFVAADNATSEAFHAAFIFPTMGTFSPLAAAAEVGSFHWPWYKFPLQNGTWTDNLSSRGGDGKPYGYPVTLTARPKTGGFDVEMRREGRLVAMYDYSTASHWFTEFRLYDGTRDSTPEQWIGRVVTQAFGHDYRGDYFDDTGDVLLQFQNVQAPGSTPAPQATFTMTADQNKLLILRITFAADGAAETTILDPNMDPATKVVYHQEAYGQAGQSADTLLVPGIAGQWQVIGSGGGVVTGSLVFAYGIHERAAKL